MVAFEISINGNPLPPMKSPGFGTLMANVAWTRGEWANGIIYEHGFMARAGTKKGLDTETLPFDYLKIGDEITIRIVDRQSPEISSSRDLSSS